MDVDFTKSYSSPGKGAPNFVFVQPADYALNRQNGRIAMQKQRQVA